MTQSEIMQKAVEKATKNGFKIEYLIPSELTYNPAFYKLNNGGLRILKNGEYILSVKDIIFSHDFAKAFWRDGSGNSKHWNFKVWEIGKEDYDDLLLPEWKYRLMQMILDDNPILYLERFL